MLFGCAIPAAAPSPALSATPRFTRALLRLMAQQGRRRALNKDEFTHDENLHYEMSGRSARHFPKSKRSQLYPAVTSKVANFDQSPA
jgi:hypothetical protein